MPASPSVIADRFVQLRIFTAVVVSFGLVANYGTTYSLQPQGWLDVLHLLMGPFQAALLLLILAVGHEALWSARPAVRALLGDDSTTEHRRRAQAFGFWFMVLAGVAVYVAGLVFPMPPAKAAQLVVTLAISGAALRFGYLEQRALRGG